MPNTALKQKLIAVAPMMAWTDRHCRHLHRLYSPSVVLFSEMITTGALIHGKQLHQLKFDDSQHPVAVQLGGNDPHDLADCARLAETHGYDEVNLNVGCPSDRVQRGTFGASLMQTPQLVADCVQAMGEAVAIPVTVKCRTGIQFKGDGGRYQSAEFLLEFVDAVHGAGCQRLYLHARNAILGGLTPAQNRDIPPLQPERGRLIKSQFPKLELIMNGGINAYDKALELLHWADGVMIGRAAYENPFLIKDIDTELYGIESNVNSKKSILNQYLDYVEEKLQEGHDLSRMMKHLFGLSRGDKFAKTFRIKILEVIKKESLNTHRKELEDLLIY